MALEMNIMNASCVSPHLSNGNSGVEKHAFQVNGLIIIIYRLINCNYCILPYIHCNLYQILKLLMFVLEMNKQSINTLVNNDAED